jgi:methylglutaconyl-CoA hydratase
MGEGKARRVFMSARLFDAHEAKALDLVADVVDADAIDDRIAREIEPYLSTAPNAVAAAKRLARQLGPRIDDAVIDHSIECLADTWDGEEARQGVEAFFAKTKAPWIR